MIARRGLRGLIEEHDRALQQARATEGLDGFYDQAFRMLSSPAAKKAFNLDLEPPSVRDRYGRNEWGEGFLLSRRLVEAGVGLPQRFTLGRRGKGLPGASRRQCRTGRTSSSTTPTRT